MGLLSLIVMSLLLVWMWRSIMALVVVYDTVGLSLGLAVSVIGESGGLAESPVLAGWTWGIKVGCDPQTRHTSRRTAATARSPFRHWDRPRASADGIHRVLVCEENS